MNMITYLVTFQTITQDTIKTSLNIQLGELEMGPTGEKITQSYCHYSESKSPKEQSRFIWHFLASCTDDHTVTSSSVLIGKKMHKPTCDANDFNLQESRLCFFLPDCFQTEYTGGGQKKIRCWALSQINFHCITGPDTENDIYIKYVIKYDTFLMDGSVLEFTSARC